MSSLRRGHANWIEATLYKYINVHTHVIQIRYHDFRWCKLNCRSSRSCDAIKMAPKRFANTNRVDLTSEERQEKWSVTWWVVAGAGEVGLQQLRLSISDGGKGNWVNVFSLSCQTMSALQNSLSAKSTYETITFPWASWLLFYIHLLLSLSSSMHFRLHPFAFYIFFYAKCLFSNGFPVVVRMSSIAFAFEIIIFVIASMRNSYFSIHSYIVCFVINSWMC